MIYGNRVYFCSKKSFDTWLRLMCDDKATLSKYFQDGDSVVQNPSDLKYLLMTLNELNTKL